MSNDFLVSVRLTRYLTRWAGESPFTTAIPSTGWHMNYAEADRMVQRLRDAGFAEAHACTVRGLPATPQDIFDAEHARDAQPTQ
jgi:hypothetical protein